MMLVKFHGTAPLVAYYLTSNGFHSQVPQPYRDQLNRVYKGTLYRNVLLSKELASILETFNKEGIAVIPLKGNVLAETIYENPVLRLSADMDILVHLEDKSQAGVLINSLGYQQMTETPHWDHHFHEVPYHKQAAFPLVLELHWDLEDRRLVNIANEEIWCRAQPHEFQGSSTMVLSPEDNLLFLSNHLTKHNDELLKFLGDIAELLKKYQDTLDWDYIIASAHSWQTDTAVYYALANSRDILGAPVLARVLKALRPRIWRRGLLRLLMNQEDFVIPSQPNWLRDWTSAVARGLMMKHLRQTLIVLSRQQGSYKKGAWLRTTFWIVLVLATAVWRNGVIAVSKPWSPK